MNTSADAADQVVRMSLNGAEVALKVSGKGAKEITVLLAKALKSSMSQSNRTKGSIRLQNLVHTMIELLPNFGTGIQRMRTSSLPV